MGFYSQVEIVRRQGLPSVEKAFVTWAIQQAVDQFTYGCEPRVVCIHDDGGVLEPEVSEADMRVALLAPVSFAAVIADVCRLLKVEVPIMVESVLGGEPEPLPAA